MVLKNWNSRKQYPCNIKPYHVRFVVSLDFYSITTVLEPFQAGTFLTLRQFNGFYCSRIVCRIVIDVSHQRRVGGKLGAKFVITKKNTHCFRKEHVNYKGNTLTMPWINVSGLEDYNSQDCLLLTSEIGWYLTNNFLNY